MIPREPRWTRDTGAYLATLPDPQYGVVDVYITAPSRHGDGDLIVRWADGPGDALRVPINSYVRDWLGVPEAAELAFLAAVDLGVYNDTLH